MAVSDRIPILIRILQLLQRRVSETLTAGGLTAVLRCRWQTKPQMVALALATSLLQGCGPVSYTHLRAHETVLDLVCRLLLEKKTNPSIL